MLLLYILNYYLDLESHISHRRPGKGKARGGGERAVSREAHGTPPTLCKLNVCKCTARQSAELLSADNELLSAGLDTARSARQWAAANSDYSPAVISTVPTT